MNSSRCSPTSFLRKTHLTPPRWRNKHATSPSFSRPFPIQSAAASSQTFRGRGNVTGFTNIEPTTAGKWLELLKEIAPHVARVAFLFNPATAPYEYYLSSFKAAARSFAVEAIAAPVRDRSELEPVITALARAEWWPSPDDGYFLAQSSPRKYRATKRELLVSRLHFCRWRLGRCRLFAQLR